MTTSGGSAQPVTVNSSAAQSGGAAIPVVVVPAGTPQTGGPSMPVYVVTSGPIQGGSAMPVYAASAGAPTFGGSAVPVFVVSGSLSSDPDLVNPSFVAQNTTSTNAMGPDGYSWSQSGVNGPLVVDHYGKLVALTEDAGGNHEIVYSNNLGVTWAESLSLGFLTRGAIAYNAIDDAFCVLWAAQATTDGILFREYVPTRDGAHNITGFTIIGGAYTQLDAQGLGTMQYEHPAILWLSDIGAHGTIIAAWCCRNTGVGGTGNEIRAVMRTLTNDANDLIAANWTHVGVSSVTTIGNAPLAGSYTALLANATTGIPHVALARLADSSLFVAYHTGTVTGGSMAGSWSYRRVPWTGTDWTPLGAATVISAIVRAGADTGYANKGELISKPVQDASGNVYLGIATWKSNVLGDTWGYAQITPGDVVTLVDDYSANGAHSYAPTGDIDYDTITNRIISSYITTTDQFAYVHLFTGIVEDGSATLAFDTAPVDIPLLHTRAVPGKLALLFRDTNTPHRGWFGTLDWQL